MIGGGGGDNWMVTLFIEGEAVADAKGIKKNIKYSVAEAAMEYLRLDEQEQEEDVLVAEGLDLTPVLEATKS